MTTRAQPARNAIFARTVRLEPEQILAINDERVEAVPAPGEGKVIVPWGTAAVLRFATTPYEAADYLALAYASDPEYVIVPFVITLGQEANGLIANVQNGGLSLSDDEGEQSLTFAEADDQPLVFVAVGSGPENPINGDSPIEVTTYYSVVDL